jgi:hypothetical protein
MATRAAISTEQGRDAQRQRAERRLLDTLRSEITSGRYDSALDGDPDALAGRMLAALPQAKHPADALVGPFYDTSGVAVWRGVSRQAITKAAAKRDLLGLKIADGSLLFPSFQFGTHGEPLPNLREVLDLVDPDRIDPWGSALWLNTPHESFGGVSAAEALRAGRTEQVLRVAERAAREWAS